MRKILSAGILLFPAFLSIGQNTSRTLLWEVSKAGIQDTSYLFGTFHEVDQGFFFALSNAVQKLEQADLLFVEEVTSSGNDETSAEEQGQSYHWSAEKWNQLTTGRRK